MKLDKLHLDGKKDSIEVLDKIFSAKINKKLVSSVLYKTNANYKGRHAKTKQQNEVSGPTSKIYAQKGTGGARHASRKAPIFVGGGIAHGPKGELSYKKRKLNKSEKKLSVASLITEKNKNKNLLVFSDFNNEIKKTKEMHSIIKKFEITNSLIILDKNSKDKIEKSVRNIPNVKVTDVNHFSSFDIIKFKKSCFHRKLNKRARKEIFIMDKLHLYDKILSPLVTEKTTNLSEQNKVVFKVPASANKKNLKTNIEKIFKVNVTKINIINKQNRTKLTRGKKVKVSGFKKAIITLKKGQSIDLTTGD
jgi:large subunit ribosomal protein L4